MQFYSIFFNLFLNSSMLKLVTQKQLEHRLDYIAEIPQWFLYTRIEFNLSSRQTGNTI